MDNRAEVREFLSSRRARLTPEQAGLPADGGNRRVKGLRREEVAMLAGQRPGSPRGHHRSPRLGPQRPPRPPRREPAGRRVVRADARRPPTARWAAHNVRFHRTGRKKLHHPAVGDLDLNFEAMELPSHPGLTLLVYTAPKNTPTADNLKLLSAWAATTQVGS